MSFQPGQDQANLDRAQQKLERELARAESARLLAERERERESGEVRPSRSLLARLRTRLRRS